MLNNKDLPDELVAKGIIDRYLFGCLNHLTNDSDKLSKILRQTSSFLNTKDIERISQNLGQSPSSDDKTFINEIEKFGIKVPKSEKEIDEMLE